MIQVIPTLLPVMGKVYHQSRADVWAMTPREADLILRDWADTESSARAPD